MENIPVILLASARKDSDTKKFIEKVFSNTEYKVIDLLDFTVLPYDYSHQYSEKDEFFKIIEELMQHETIVFATPVYWYSMSGLMKTFFDRLTDLVTIKKTSGRDLKDKSTFLVAVGTDKELPVGFDKPFELTSWYLHMLYLGHIYFSTKHQLPVQMMEYIIELFIQKVKDNSDRSSNS